MRMKSLQDLFLHEIKDLPSTEKQLTKTIPKMAETASSSQLKETNLGSTKCDVMEGLSTERLQVPA